MDNSKSYYYYEKFCLGPDLIMLGLWCCMIWDGTKFKVFFSQKKKKGMLIACILRSFYSLLLIGALVIQSSDEH